MDPSDCSADFLNCCICLVWAEVVATTCYTRRIKQTKKGVYIPGAGNFIQEADKKLPTFIAFAQEKDHRLVERG
jgi:hypothetical protein